MSTPAVTPDFIPAEQPDFIPDSQGLSPSTRAAIRQDYAAPTDAPNGSAITRFVKGAGGTYLNATLNAGPTSGPAIDYSDPEVQRAMQLPESRGRWQVLKDSVYGVFHPKYSAGEMVQRAGSDLIHQFNPIDVQKFQSGDTAGGIGSTMMNLLLLRAGYKQMRGAQVPEFGLPNQTAEIVQPLTRNPIREPLALPAAPIELGPSSIIPPTQEGLLPAASILRRSPQGELIRQYLTRALREGEVPPVAKDTNTLSQNYFIDKMRRALEEPQGTGMEEAQAVDARMAELAKKPVDVGGSVPTKAMLGKAQPVSGMEGLFDYPIMRGGKQIGNARISVSGGEARVGAIGPVGYRPGGEPLELGAADARAMRTQFEAQNPGVKLKWNPGSASNERAAARVQRRSSLQSLQENLSQPQPTQFMTEGSDLIKALQQMARAKAAD